MQFRDGALPVLRWNWTRGIPALSQGDFGDPVNGGSSYRLCVYDETGGAPLFKMGATIQAGGTCGTRACWKAQGTSGWTYWDKDGSSDGITKMVLKGGGAGRPLIKLRGKGSSLRLPAPLSGTEFFDQDTAVILQLRSTTPANCWSSSFDGSSTKKNDGGQFKATTP